MTLWEFGPLVRENGEIGWKLLQTLARFIREEQASVVGEPA
jgi:hypothetical protein